MAGRARVRQAIQRCVVFCTALFCGTRLSSLKIGLVRQLQEFGADLYFLLRQVLSRRSNPLE